MKQIVEVTENPKEYLDLLLLADPSEEMVDKYLSKGRVFLLTEEQHPVCIAVVIEVTADSVELKNIATDEQYQKRGYATEMIRYLWDTYRKDYKQMLVGTSDYGVPFYEKIGFIRSHAVKDFFIDNYPEPIIEHGMQCIDMIYLKKDFDA